MRVPNAYVSLFGVVSDGFGIGFEPDVAPVPSITNAPPPPQAAAAAAPTGGGLSLGAQFLSLVQETLGADEIAEFEPAPPPPPPPQPRLQPTPQPTRVQPTYVSQPDFQPAPVYGVRRRYRIS